jgi:UDP-N-acetylglucosamine 2-epimerase (non-hydrolysing)/GDP/UDP-N,N'-diacetylbacillosamine 2-epimerase (hydrolysing)
VSRPDSRARAYRELAPDLVLVLGDRFEILAAVSAALVSRVPVAHLCGGDVTEGAWDEGIRHAITKMAHLHFPTHDAAARRIIAMGEAPERVVTAGSTGIDNLLGLDLLSREELEADLGFRFRTRNVLVTHHPETLASDGAGDLDALLDALADLGDDVGIVFTLPNADTGGDAVRTRVEEFAAAHDNAGAWTSLGLQRYASVMSVADAVVGNSSSGLYEAPSLRTPTVNVGGRQAGRPCATSVRSAPAEREAIVAAIRSAFETDCTDAVNPYGDGHATERIVAALEAIDDFRDLLRKGFHEEAS